MNHSESVNLLSVFSCLTHVNLYRYDIKENNYEAEVRLPPVSNRPEALWGIVMRNMRRLGGRLTIQSSLSCTLSGALHWDRDLAGTGVRRSH